MEEVGVSALLVCLLSEDEEDDEKNFESLSLEEA